MRKVVVTILLLFGPAWLFAQTEQEKYDIYSQYLYVIKAKVKGGANFVIRESTNYGRTDDADISPMVDDLRKWYDHDTLQNITKQMAKSTFYYFPYKIRSDSAWVGLMARLDENLKQRFVIQNKFDPKLPITIISDKTYNKIFKKKHPTKKFIDKMWPEFHKRYPIPAYLIDFSDITTDGKRAVFYFARRWDFRGGTAMVFFEKSGSGWQYLETVNLIAF